MTLAGTRGDADHLGRQRLRQIFEYLQALDELRNPPPRLAQNQRWHYWLSEVPADSSVQMRMAREEFVEEADYRDGGADADTLSEGAFQLTVTRPNLTDPPTPPQSILPWLSPGWQEPERSLTVRQVREEPGHGGEPISVRFDDDPRRVLDFEEWRPKWEAWSERERPRRAGRRFFDRLYSFYTDLEREPGSIEFVLGDGILAWSSPIGDIYHPVLLQRLVLEFHPERPAFTLREAEHAPELYSSLLRELFADGRALAQLREEWRDRPIHPLEGRAALKFLRRLVVHLSPGGEVRETRPSGGDRTPVIGRDPMILVRNRGTGLGEAIEGILQGLDDREDLPSTLLRIVGIDPIRPEPPDPAEPTLFDNEEDEILFSKEANAEQVESARRLERYKAVLVQGPPGTGKTHTIANLIGHLLAQGKSILVTSHTAKALTVLRDQLVPELQPLCVSVLQSDAETRKQLEAGVGVIVDRLAEDPEHLERQALQLAAQRTHLTARLRQAREQLLKGLRAEYDEIVIAGNSWSPSEAARYVRSRADQDGWIPSPVELGAPLPLSHTELAELYRTNRSLSVDDEREFAETLPDVGVLPTPTVFEALVSAESWEPVGAQGGQEAFWDDIRAEHDPDQLDALLSDLGRSVQRISEATPWELAVVAAGRDGGAHREPWENLLGEIDRVVELAAQAEESLLRYGPTLAPGEPLDQQIHILEDLIQHLTNGGRIGFWDRLRRPSWKRLIAAVSVSGREPKTLEEFQALLMCAQLELARKGLLARWERQMTPLDGPTVSDLGDRPEQACRQFVGPIRRALDWHADVWTPLEAVFPKVGFRWSAFLATVPPHLARHGELLRLRDAVLEHLPPIYADRVGALRQYRAKQALQRLDDQLARHDRGDTGPPVIRTLRTAVRARDVRAYQTAYQRLVQVSQQMADLVMRRDLLRRLEAAAPGWAAAIAAREAPHTGPYLPGDPTAAWLWRQLKAELDARARISLDELQRQIAETRAELRRVTAELVECRAWAAQIRGTSLSQRQSLVGWLHTVRRIGRGTGKRVPRLRAQAREQMQNARTAVPVWVVPLSQLADHFDISSTRFDVVIIDEASQCDVMALVALYMAREVIIVGDDQQVSPMAVGQVIDKVQRLIDERLVGVPNKELYTGELSIYDLAMQSFGGVVSLREHFRSVPQIIQFSNHLSYDGRIRPLRDTSHVQLNPPVVAYRVSGARLARAGRINEAEANTVASLLIAATEQPEYKEKTFGVISLVGDEQAAVINRILQTHLSPIEYASRRIVCGNPAHFQGDERDVIFLSLVDTPGDGPLSLRAADMYRKRFNVAASRARDQMWVVYSLDPDRDLKPGDLRLRLIRHAQDPDALVRAMADAEQETESEFERLVLRHLIGRGYRVIPQWEVGTYRIDLVVEGAGRRLAIECDGDRFHPPEQLQQDMERQAILERLGWTFVRIRGSEFFRDPDSAMARVYARLNDLGIPPEGPLQETETEDEDTELRDRIIRRAAEIRRAWGVEDNPLDHTIALQSRLPESMSPPKSDLKRDIHGDISRPVGDTQMLPERVPAKGVRGRRRVSRATRSRRADQVTSTAPLLPVDSATDPGSVPVVDKSQRPNTVAPREETMSNPGSPDSVHVSPPEERSTGTASPPPVTVHRPRVFTSIMDRLEHHLPDDAWWCSTCDGGLDLTLHADGPILTCSRCQSESRLPPRTVDRALKDLRIRCGSCHRPIGHKFFRSNKPVIGCTSPRCGQQVTWRSLTETS